MPRKKFHNDKVSIFVPDSLDLDAFGPVIMANKHNVLMFLDLLNWRSMIGIGTRADVQYVSTDSLAELFGWRNQVKPIRDAMVNAGFIECDYKYSNIEGAAKAYGYRLGPVTRDLTYRPRYLQDKRAVQRLIDFRSKVYKVDRHLIVNDEMGERIEDIDDTDLPVYDYVRECLARVSVRDGFEEQIDGAPWLNLRARKPKKNEKLPAVEVCPKAQAKSALQILAQPLPPDAKLREERKTKVKPDKQGRIYHVVTNLNRMARGHVQLDGQPLWEVDMANAQLYLLAMVILEVYCTMEHSRSLKQILSYREKTKEEKRTHKMRYCYQYGNEPSEDFPKYGNVPFQSDSLDHHGNPISLRFQAPPADMLRFAKDTSEGRFYERLMERLPDSDRGTVKRETIMAVMAENWRAKNFEPYQIMRLLYPSVIALLEELKLGMGHEWVGRTLQSFESAVMIGNVCQRTEAEGIPVIPLHDCCFSVEENVERVRDIIVEEFVKFFGWKPTAEPKPVMLPEADNQGEECIPF